MHRQKAQKLMQGHVSFPSTFNIQLQCILIHSRVIFLLKDLCLTGTELLALQCFKGSCRTKGVSLGGVGILFIELRIMS